MKHTIRNFLDENLTKNNILITDEYRSYNNLKEDYNKHHKVNHGNKEYVNGTIHTNSIEGFWSILKRGIKGTYIQVSEKYLQNYLDEFMFRFNNRDEVNLFRLLIEKI